MQVNANEAVKAKQQSYAYRNAAPCHVFEAITPVVHVVAR
jgi:hypothetical protein